MANSGSVLIRGARVIDGTGNPWFYSERVLRHSTHIGATPGRWLRGPAAGDVEARD